MDYMGPYIRRQQRIGEARGRAYTLFSGYLEGELSAEWCARQIGISSAQLWEDGGEKDSDLDAFLLNTPFCPAPQPPGPVSPSE